MKKKLIIAAIFAALVGAMLAVGYITNEKKTDNLPKADEHIISAAPTEGISGEVYDEPPADVWAEDDSTGYNGFTTRAQLGSDGESIGVLEIEKIGLSVHVYDSDPDTVLEDMKKGVAHYKSTSYFDGNVGLSAHNGNASYSFFDRLKELKEGDTLTYQTELGTRSYRVQTIATIADDDWSMLERTEDNRLTLTTCITGQETQRLCVQAVEVAG